jgi:hypothetical protein
MRSIMKTNLKMILTAAVSVAALASPALAQSESHAAPTTASISTHARGAAAHAHTGRLATESVTEDSRIRLDDCVHVAFPQCGDSPLFQPDHH